MMDADRISRSMVYQVKQEALSWTGGQASRTIGSGGNLNTTRPDRIESAYWRDSANQDHPLHVLSAREQYDNLTVKSTQTDFPEYLFYDSAYPLGVLYLYCVPSATATLLLNSWQQLQTFADTATALALPPGYEDYIVSNLALRLAPEYPGTVVTQELRDFARTSKAAVKMNNLPAMISRTDSALLGRTQRSAGSILNG